MSVPVVVEELVGIARDREPLSVGLPLERGVVRDARRLELVDNRGELIDAQFTPLSQWSDSSIRWVLVDTLVSVDAWDHRELELRYPSAPSADDRPVPRPISKEIELHSDHRSVAIDTGEISLTIPRAGAQLVSCLRIGSTPVIHEAKGLELILTDARWKRHRVELTSVVVSDAGPFKCSVTLKGRLGPILEASARVTVWSGRGLIRIDLTIGNPTPAKHIGGTWDLGDPGSLLFRDISLRTRLAAGGEDAVIGWTDRAERPLRDEGGGFLEIYQDSSGGERWNYKTHLNRHGEVPHSFRGYRVRNSRPGSYGDRASPSLWLSTSDVDLGATIVSFWQNFPKALETRQGTLTVRLWPHQFRDLHELQGGEQKTHTIWLSAERPTNLGWTQSPLVARSTPGHYVKSDAFPHLIEWEDDENEELLELTREVVDPERGLVARRESIDEYGWRNFGDVFADHEDAGNTAPLPRVSHYNNQYDGIYATLAQFARSGDARWFQLGHEMACHVADIDIYHTELDRSAFSGGLFWHTDHHTDAETSTHRCYSNRCPQAQEGSYGGGPSAEHDYARGLAMHYFMTGWLPSRQGALSLAKWVISMDGPDDSFVGQLLPGSSGLATRTDDHSYHGPGRGAGNSVETLLDALALTGNEAFLLKAEELIRRCIHPHDDRESFELTTNPEVRWSYTVMLLALADYLEVKAERGELDERYAYAQASLVAYAQWMLEQEKLSSAKKDRLQRWTESWAAQDLRKGLVLLHAARHIDQLELRQRLRERGQQMSKAAQVELLAWDTRTLARPLILVMRYGYVCSWFSQHGGAEPLPVVVPTNLGRPSGFVPWKGKPKALIRWLKRRLV